MGNQRFCEGGEERYPLFVSTSARTAVFAEPLGKADLKVRRIGMEWGVARYARPLRG
jgi:hypothetical protein